MHALLIALGSAGDVHPFIGLGLALRERGHRVTLATNPYFEELVGRVGLDFVPLGTVKDLRTAMENPAVWYPLRGAGLIVKLLVLPMIRPVFELISQRYVPGETVVVAPTTALGARVAQDRLGVPLATVHLQPFALRSIHQSGVMPVLSLGSWGPRWFKRTLFWGVDRFTDRMICPQLNAFRREVGLERARSMFAWWNSPQLVLGLFPDWFAPPQPDWPANTRLTGFPLWDERGATAIPAGLEEFLAAGSPPIVFTPGSANLHGHRFFQAAIEACGLLGRRGVLLTRYPEQLPNTVPVNVRHFDFVPLSQVLPRAAALVYHGGVGTLAQGLAAGVPHLVMPMGFDQPDHAVRLRRLGVGAALAPKKFRGPAVARALAELIDSPQVQARCRELATRFDTPAALAKTCDAIESLMPQQKEVMSQRDGVR